MFFTPLKMVWPLLRMWHILQVAQHIIEALLSFKTLNNDNTGLFPLLFHLLDEIYYEQILLVNILSTCRHFRWANLMSEKAKQAKLQLYNQNHCRSLIIFLVIVG